MVLPSALRYLWQLQTQERVSPTANDSSRFKVALSVPHSAQHSKTSRLVSWRRVSVVFPHFAQDRFSATGLQHFASSSVPQRWEQT